MTVYRDTLPSCPECEIRMRRIGRFGHINDALLLRNIPMVERDAHGRFHAAVYGEEDHELITYDADGEIVRTIGGYGSGPGEFRSVWDIRVSGDSLFVGHDDRVSVFDSAGTYARSVRLNPPGLFTRRFVLIQEGRIITTGPIPTKESGVPLHEYGEDGRHRRAFGPRPLLADYNLARGVRPASLRITGVDRDGSLWLYGGGGGYRLENVDLEGDLRRVIGVIGPPDWRRELFMTTAEYEEHMRETRSTTTRSPPLRDSDEPLPTEGRLSGPPSMSIAALEGFDDGLLLALVRVASPDWADVTIPYDTLGRYEGVTPYPGFRERAYDTLIDVLDTATGALVARRRISGAVRLTSDGTLYRPSVSDDGVITVEAFEIEVEGLAR